MQIGSGGVVVTEDKLLAGAISQQALRTIEALLQVVANGSVIRGNISPATTLRDSVGIKLPKLAA